MSLAFTCPACGTGYKLPAHLAATRPVKMRCARCREVFTLEPGGGPTEPHLTTSPGSSVGRAKPAVAPKARVSPDDAVEADSHQLGAVPEDLEDLGPILGDGLERGRLPTRRGPVLGDLSPSGQRPYRRSRPPASSGRRAFLVGLVGVTALAAAGGWAVRAWRGRDWLALLSGDPFEVRVARHGALAGRAGRLYVVQGTVTNLAGAPKGFFEVRARLIDEAGETLAERTVYAGHVLADSELKTLARSELERRTSETVFGEGMANARVEPRRSIPFQVVFAPAPAGRPVADVVVSVVGVKDVP